MNKKFIEGIHLGLGFILVIGILFSVSAVGFHFASEILPGTFTGNYVFDGNVNVTGNLTQENCPSGMLKIGPWCMGPDNIIADIDVSRDTCISQNMFICPTYIISYCDRLNDAFCSWTDAGSGNEHWTSDFYGNSGDSIVDSWRTYDGDNKLYVRDSSGNYSYHCCKLLS